MRASYKIVYKGGSGEIQEKKSRFIATLRPVKNEEEALLFVEETRKKYWDARHNCYAWIIGCSGERKRLNDDGEPSQTAGRPILNVLEGEELTNVCAAVTRYFGGTLLGTGGLVRAYAAAVRKGLDHCTLLTAMPALKIEAAADYNGAGKIKHLLDKSGIPVLNMVYTDRVAVTALFPEEESEGLLSRLNELTGGQAEICGREEVYYGLLGDTAVLL